MGDSEQLGAPPTLVCTFGSLNLIMKLLLLASISLFGVSRSYNSSFAEAHVLKISTAAGTHINGFRRGRQFFLLSLLASSGQYNLAVFEV